MREWLKLITPPDLDGWELLQKLMYYALFFGAMGLLSVTLNVIVRALAGW